MKRIMVVDDNKPITTLVEKILRSAGYDCTKVNSGKECLNILRNDPQQKFDLILLDIAMPEVTGIDVVNELKKDGILQDKKIKIVFFTASSITTEEKEDLKSIGALDCMKKPFTKSELLQLMAKYTT